MHNGGVFHKQPWRLSYVFSGDEDRYSKSIFSPRFLARSTKRLFDIVSSSILLIILSPIFLIVAIAIKFDSRGPIIFRQRRLGLHGQPFMIAKFRTMTVMENGPDIAQATQNDARVTRVGRWLRMSSIDELPQLVNVLFGQMSMVGPRPHAVAHDLKYGALIPTYNQRCVVKPGITGWAQINRCRGETRTVQDMQARVDKDLWYIRNWSLWLDCLILVGTLRAVAHFEEAY